MFSSIFLKASKNVSNFYATWDLMEICTLINLVALSCEVSGHSLDEDDAKLTKDDFTNLVDKIYETIDLLKKWSQKESAENPKDDDIFRNEENQDPTSVSAGAQAVGSGVQAVNTVLQSVSTGERTVSTGGQAVNSGVQAVNTVLQSVSTWEQTVRTLEQTVNTGEQGLSTG